MLYTDIPARLVKAFAALATGTYVRAIPTTSGDPNAASLNLGFPPNTFVDEGAGGVPPDGRDMNGILKAISAWSNWQAAGGPVFYDSTFSTAIGGYPKYAILASTTLGRLWQSTVDSNTTDPDAGGANWAQLTTLNGSPNDESVTLPNGRILKDGSVVGSFPENYTGTVTFAVPFPTSCRRPLISPINSSGSQTQDSWVQVISWDRFGFSFKVQTEDGVSGSNGITWGATGY